MEAELDRIRKIQHCAWCELMRLNLSRELVSFEDVVAIQHAMNNTDDAMATSMQSRLNVVRLQYLCCMQSNLWYKLALRLQTNYAHFMLFDAYAWL
jgi:hypothetical protein